MTIAFLPSEKIDYAKWDNTIKNSTNGIVYAYSWYLDIAAKQWSAIILNDYEAVFPFAHRSKYGFDYIYQPFFIQQLGYFSQGKMDYHTFRQILENIPVNFKHIYLQCNTHNPIVENTNFTFQSRNNFHLDLIPPYELLYKNYSDNIKRNLKKAKKADLKIVKNINPQDIINLFRQNSGKRIKNLQEKDYATVSQLMYKCIELGIGEIRGIYNPYNELSAALFLIYSHGKIISLLIASDDYAKQHGAIPHLFDSIIKEHAQKRIILDFEGSNIESLARFYGSFGASSINYFALSKNTLPWYIKWFKK